MIRFLTLFVLCHLPFAPLSLSAETGALTQETEQEWEVLLHSHGMSPGDWDSVEDLQRVALASGLDAVVLTEQMMTEWEWSPPIIRWFWSFRLKNPDARSIRELFRTAPSVKRIGFEEYFQKAAEADQAVPELWFYHFVHQITEQERRHHADEGKHRHSEKGYDKSFFVRFKIFEGGFCYVQFESEYSYLRCVLSMCESLL